MLSIIYSLLCIFIPCILYQFLLYRRHKQEDHLPAHFIQVYIFLFYLYSVLATTDIGSIWEIGHYDTIVRLEEINLLPFQSEGVMTYLLNIIMFLPLGFLLPLIWKKYRNPVKIILTGFNFSLAIEICQLFNRRNSDIDDLMMNTLGSIIGYFIWLLTKPLLKKPNRNAVSLSDREPAVYLVFAVLGRFFLYNWRLLV